MARPARSIGIEAGSPPAVASSEPEPPVAMEANGGSEARTPPASMMMEEDAGADVHHESGASGGGEGVQSARPSGALGAGGATGASGAGGAGGAATPRFCILPLSCVPVDTIPVALDPCCADDGGCGYQVTRPEELRDGTCKPTREIFLRQPGRDEQRVVVDGAPDQLITPDCETRTLLAFPLPGCCMPNNRCGVSTYQVTDILFGLALVPAAYTSVECVSVETLNLQFDLTTLAGLGQIPPSDGECDYADLDARLKAPDAP